MYISTLWVFLQSADHLDKKLIQMQAIVKLESRNNVCLVYCLNITEYQNRLNMPMYWWGCLILSKFNDFAQFSCSQWLQDWNSGSGWWCDFWKFNAPVKVTSSFLPTSCFENFFENCQTTTSQTKEKFWSIKLSETFQVDQPWYNAHEYMVGLLIGSNNIYLN